MMACVAMLLCGLHAGAEADPGLPVFAVDSVKNARLQMLPGLKDDASAEPRYDLNNKLCALIKVAMADTAGVRFYGNIVGDVQYRQGTFWVYVTDGTKLLRLKKGDNDVYNLNFGSMLLKKRVKSGDTYVLCGFDNDATASVSPEVEAVYPAVASEMRQCVRAHATAFADCDSLFFEKLYSGKDLRDNEVNGDMLRQLSHDFKAGEKTYALAPNIVVIKGPVAGTYCIRLGIVSKDKNGNANPEGYSFMLWDTRDHPERGEILIATLQTIADVIEHGVYSAKNFEIE